MPETVIESQRPLVDAIARVTNGGRDRWQFEKWTHPGTSNNATRMIGAFFHVERKNPVATSGMSGKVFHPKGTERNFTIRHDYDFKLGMPSAGKGGKGYHVNVELPGEKFAFASPNMGEQYFSDAVQMLSQRVQIDGDAKAAEWFMNPTGR